MYVVHVTITVKPEAIDAFLEATADNHRNTIQEPAAHRFDVLRDTTSEHVFYLYEVYDDEAGFKAHQQTEHYLRWKATVTDMMAEARQATKATSIHPDPWN